MSHFADRPQTTSGAQLKLSAPSHPVTSSLPSIAPKVLLFSIKLCIVMGWQQKYCIAGGHKKKKKTIYFYLFIFICLHQPFKKKFGSKTSTELQTVSDDCNRQLNLKSPEVHLIRNSSAQLLTRTERGWNAGRVLVVSSGWLLRLQLV